MKESSATKVEKAVRTPVHSAHQRRASVRAARTQARVRKRKCRTAPSAPDPAHEVSGTHRRNWDISPQFDANAGGRGVR